MKHLLWLACLPALTANAAEQRLHGVVDVRATNADSVQSYLEGGYGKFSSNDDVALSLGQLGLSYSAEFDSQFSAHLIGNGYAGIANDGAGITEAYIKFQGLPSATGLRLQARAGLIYPKVSLENVLTAWASPYTLDYSTLNAWLGEEVRHRGAEISLTRLGKFHESEHDVEISVAALRYNDPTGAMLAWHGWVSTSRQSLEGEKLPLPDLDTGFSPYDSEPYRELDHRTGYHVTTQWDWHGHGRVLAGYYDNNADPHVVEDLQWAWATRFAHVGVKWQLPADIELVAQYLAGNTLMQSSHDNVDLVFNDFHSGFVLLSRKIERHRISARLEEFAVVDRDDNVIDNNNEYGKAATINYTFQLNRACSLVAEHTWLRSIRPVRANEDLPVELTEQHTQLAMRYFF